MYPTRASVRRSAGGAPRRVIDPPVGRASESSSLTSVVFPARFGPSSPNTPPAGTRRETPRRASTRRPRPKSPDRYVLATFSNTAASGTACLRGREPGHCARTPELYPPGPTLGNPYFLPNIPDPNAVPMTAQPPITAPPAPPPATAPNPCPPVVAATPAPSERAWVTGEYLLWWVRDGNLPFPVATTGPAA